MMKRGSMTLFELTEAELRYHGSSLYALDGLEILEHRKHHLNQYISLLNRSYFVLFDLGHTINATTPASATSLSARWIFLQEKIQTVMQQLERGFER